MQVNNDRPPRDAVCYRLAQRLQTDKDETSSVCRFDGRLCAQPRTAFVLCDTTVALQIGKPA